MPPLAPTEGQASRAYWQSLADWLSGAESSDVVAEDGTRIDRRAVLALLGASIGLAGVSGCDRQATEKILPYTITPEDITPGIAATYATSMELDGFATGLLVRSHDGRPTKIEGNPDHPASLGAAGPFEQASVLSLYDPHRARAARFRTSPATFEQVIAKFGGPRDDAGGKLRFLLEPTGSPLVGEMLEHIQTRFPEARFSFHSAIRSPNSALGGLAAFGTPLQPQYDFTRASVILAIDADFLSSMPFHLRYARQFAERRRASSPSDEMNRLYAVESMPTPTGAIADHRLRKKPSDMGPLLGAVAAELAVLLGGRLPDALGRALSALRPSQDDVVVRAIARDLAKNGTFSVVVVGEKQPANVHAAAYLMNVLLLRSAAFRAIEPTDVGGTIATEPIDELVREMEGHHVDTLVALGGNPAYTAPADLEFSRRLALVDDSIYLGPYENETAAETAWFVPAAHFLESWSDARAYDGTISFVQPLIEPLFAGRTTAEVLAVFAGDRTPRDRLLLRNLWSRKYPRRDFDAFFEDALVRGLVQDSASTDLDLRPNIGGLVEAVTGLSAARRAPPSLELAFVADPGIYDGRFANNGWLQELPKPLTKLTWDNAAMMSRATALRMRVADEDVVEVHRSGRSITLPVLVVPGHADDAISVCLGYGRKGAETLALGVGANAYVLRTTDSLGFADAIDVRKVEGAHHPLARTQLHFSTESRPIALSATREAWLSNPDFTEDERGPLPTFFHPARPAREQWAMTIDMSICTGCSACVLGCQSENNIFVVGRENVLKRREMHWLRIDTYYSGPPDEPTVVHEPMLCQHCEKAPCEYVCPVNATVHSPDGLNEMVYNRCVGTRFCSNNCPYKVRRFNWFDWVDRQPANQGLVRLQRNPNVTVRERGVMEKCTYCVQRIRSAEITARNENRAIRPGEVVTACQQACPTQAIQFGSLGHAETKMVKWRRESRAFDVLHELGTTPRTRYLAAIRNPNPELGS